MAGIPITLNEVNARITNLSLATRNTLSEVRTVKTRLVDVLGASGLVALGMSQADADKTISVILDLDKLARIAIGQEVQAAPSDFFFNARDVVGLA